MSRMTLALQDRESLDNKNVRFLSRIQYKLGRGGYYGMKTEDALEFLNLPVSHAKNLPNKVGFALEDVGGGMNVPRMFPSQEAMRRGVPKSVVRRLAQFVKGCRARYLELQEMEEQYEVT